MTNPAPFPQADVPPTHAQQLGHLGERVAVRWLTERGWRILQLRYRSGHRDVDVIAERRGTVAFVEVKARSGVSFGDPIEAVNWFKKKQLVKSASCWISLHGRPGERYRFDVIGVWISRGRVRVRHVENAFELPAVLGR
jgi:putative endonuclease